MKNSNNTITIPKTEYNSLKKIETDFNQLIKEETRFFKEIVDLFSEENRTLKKEIYNLAHRIETLKQLAKEDSLEALQESLGVGSSE